MTFLELCQRLRREAGLSGSGPQTTVSQTGESLNMVEWIQSAYTDIQNLYPDWKFLQTEFSFNCTIGKREYSLADLSLTDLNRWRTIDWDSFRYYLTDEATEQYAYVMAWDDFRSIYQFGTTRTSSGQPQYVAVKPDKSLIFYQTPDQEYTINCEYYKKADILSGDSDEPIFPSQFHMVIVWRALTFYGAFDAAQEKYAQGQNEYKRILSALKKDQRQSMRWGAPLA